MKALTCNRTVQRHKLVPAIDMELFQDLSVIEHLLGIMG